MRNTIEPGNFYQRIYDSDANPQSILSLDLLKWKAANLGIAKHSERNEKFGDPQEY